MLFMSLVKISRFTNDAIGLEKTLRFLQSFVQVIAAYSASSADAKPWLQARAQFTLCRKFLRFFRFVDAFTLAYQTVSENSGLVAILSTGKWSCLGMYLFLECFTILDAMGVWSSEWAGQLFVESMRFWFYSISFSILLNLLLLSRALSTSSGRVKKVGAKEMKSRGNYRGPGGKALQLDLTKKLVSDCCDIFIPGFATGWLVVSSGTVGILGMISTILSSGDVWRRVQTAS